MIINSIPSSVERNEKNIQLNEIAQFVMMCALNGWGELRYDVRCELVFEI